MDNTHKFLSRNRRKQNQKVFTVQDNIPTTHIESESRSSNFEVKKWKFFLVYLKLCLNKLKTFILITWIIEVEIVCGCVKGIRRDVFFVVNLNSEFMQIEFYE